ncbi:MULTISPECIES: LexA family protein [unclassified Acinetobacter]|uniref:LexA family protein n=1 Tax=unclassified Acinetobacter TaxID=196816 RepID=UPI00190BEB0C|nr:MULTISPECIES: S24 family peptidase [unclassified Acinetobacter]MBK0062177.1 helix-turn-helix domain-containing protein [Acinetobacter sp. S55]MBK0065981.1 helix-turn-helix domain-containing protein [Acinetobacter sp. S54]
MIGARLKEARKKAGKSQKDVVEAIGITQSALSQLENGLVSSSSHLPSIARFLNVDAYWLQTGELPNSSKLDNDKFESNVSFINSPLRQIPLLDYVQAGLFHEVGYDGLNPLGTSWTTYEGARPECVFSLKVEGLSMAPEFVPGDELVVDGSLEPKPGSLVIAQEIQHGVARTTFKKYRVIGVNEFGVDVIELVPLNPDFPTLNSTQIEISIIGVVVAHNRVFKY